jgi:uncharacterized protein (TIGR02996 family)
MTQERDLLRAIAREPEDDAARRVYTDWLEDDGRPERAEFIRGQLRLAEARRAAAPADTSAPEPLFWGQPGSWRDPTDSPERRETAFRCRRLLDAHEAEWLRPLRGMVRREWAWSRGFVETVEANPGALAELFDLCPVRRLILTGLGGNVDALATIPADNRLTALDLILDDLDLRALRGLARLEHLSGLKEVSLLFNDLHDSAIDLLCEAPFFERLSFVRLGGNPFTHGGRQRLRERLGDRVSFTRERHPDRLFAFRGGAGPVLRWLLQGSEHFFWAGWGPDSTQLFLEEGPSGALLLIFDHAGDLLRAEVRPTARAGDAWRAELGLGPGTVRVKRFHDVHDFPKGWADQFDYPEDEPEDAEAARFLARWLDEDGFRFGSYCGGHWFSRTTGENVTGNV